MTASDRASSSSSAAIESRMYNMHVRIIIRLSGLEQEIILKRQSQNVYLCSSS